MSYEEEFECCENAIYAILDADRDAEWDTMYKFKTLRWLYSKLESIESLQKFKCILEKGGDAIDTL